MCNVVIDYDTGQILDRKDPPKEWVVEYLAVEFARIVKARKEKEVKNSE